MGLTHHRGQNVNTEWRGDFPTLLQRAKRSDTQRMGVSFYYRQRRNRFHPARGNRGLTKIHGPKLLSKIHGDRVCNASRRRKGWLVISRHLITSTPLSPSLNSSPLSHTPSLGHTRANLQLISGIIQQYALLSGSFAAPCSPSACSSAKHY